jgi:hypothetical protein
MKAIVQIIFVGIVASSVGCVVGEEGTEDEVSDGAEDETLTIEATYGGYVGATYQGVNSYKTKVFFKYNGASKYALLQTSTNYYRKCGTSQYRGDKLDMIARSTVGSTRVDISTENDIAYIVKYYAC